MKTVNVELPVELHERLKERAKLSRRSLRSEIAFLLAQFQHDPLNRVRLPSTEFVREIR